MDAAVDNEEEDEWKKKSKDTDEQAGEDVSSKQEEEEEAEQEEEDDTDAVKDEAERSSEPLAWKYEDESAVVTVRTHAPGEEDENENEQTAAPSEQHEPGHGWAERQARKGSGGQPSHKKAIVKPKKKDKKGPKRMMKSKKEKALGIKKKPRFRGR